MKFLRYALVLAFALTTTNSWALNEIIRNYRGVRGLGMGGLSTTTGTYDEALVANPAMHGFVDEWRVDVLNISVEGNDHILSDTKKFSEVTSASGSEIFSKVANAGMLGRNEHERISNVTGVYIPHFLSQNNSLAIGLMVNQQANIMLRSTIDLDIQAYVDAGPALGFARKFMDGNLILGVNVRTLYRLGADKTFKSVDFLSGKKLSLNDIGGQGMGVDGDLGGFYKIPFELPIVRFSAAASINNVAESRYDMAFRHLVKAVKSESPPLKITGMRIWECALISMTFLVFSENKAAVEVQNIGKYDKSISNWKRLHMGAETKLIGLIFVRAGFNQGYYTAGLGFDLPLLKLDFTTYGEELGTNAGMIEDRRYVGRFALEI